MASAAPKAPNRNGPPAPKRVRQSVHMASMRRTFACDFGGELARLAPAATCSSAGGGAAERSPHASRRRWRGRGRAPPDRPATARPAEISRRDIRGSRATPRPARRRRPAPAPCRCPRPCVTRALKSCGVERDHLLLERECRRPSWRSTAATTRRIVLVADDELERHSRPLTASVCFAAPRPARRPPSRRRSRRRYGRPA